MQAVRPISVALVFALSTAALTHASQGESFRRLHATEATTAAPSPFPGSWFSFRNGFQNTGNSPVAARDLFSAPSTREPWAYQTQGLVWGTPIQDGAGNVYVGSADKVFYAYSPTGEVRWTYTLPDAGDSLVDSAATLTPTGLVIVPGGDGKLHALDQATGELQWQFAAYHAGDHDSGETVNSFEGNVVLGPDGFLYAGNDNGHFYSLDLDGKERWNFETGMMIWSAAAFAPDGSWVAFGSLDTHVYVLSTTTGELIAKAKMSGEVKCTPVVDDAGRIYIGASDFGFRCLELTKGTWGGTKLKEVWKYQTGGDLYSSAALKDGNLFVGSHDGYVYSFNSGGELRWKYGVHNRVSGSPLVTNDGVVVVGAKSGKLFALDADSGERIYSIKLAPGNRKVNLDSSPAMDKTGRITLGCYNGNIYSVPVEYPMHHPEDPRVSLDAGPDVPDFDGAPPTDGATVRAIGRDGAFYQTPPEAVALHEHLTYQVVAHEQGLFVPNAAVSVSGLKVEVDPPTPVKIVPASDGYRINVIPQGFWEPETTYTVKLSGRVYHRGNPFVDLLKWWNLTPFEFTGQFTTGPAAPAPAAPPPGEIRRYAVRGLYAIQPEILDTLIPAALDGQAFVASAPFVDHERGRVGMIVLPAFPQPDGGVSLRQAPEKAFHLSGPLSGADVRAAGQLKMAAMGGTIPFAPFRISGRLTDQGIENGVFFATANVLGIKGNGGSYTGLSWQAIDDMADSKLRLQAFGTFEGKRMATIEMPVSEISGAWTGRKEFQVRLRLQQPVTGRHMVTVAFWDAAEGVIAAQQTVTLGSEEGTLSGEPVTLDFAGLSRRKHSRLMRVVLFDGARVPQGE